MTVPRDYDPYAQMQQTAQPARALFESDINEKVPSGNQLLQGATLRTSTAFGRAATVKAGEDIRPALESLKSAGGGTLILLAGTHTPEYDLIGSSKVSIIGEGRQQTIIDFQGGAYGIKYIDDGGVSVFESFRLADFTVQNSNATAAIQCDFADYFIIENVRVAFCDQHGISIQRCQNFELRGVTAYGNTDNGIQITSTATNPRVSQKFSLHNCNSLLNGGHGFVIESSTAASSSVTNFSLSSCQASNNSGDGFYVAWSSFGRVEQFSIVGCQSNDNTGDGFDLNAGTNNTGFFCSLVSCHAAENGGNGFSSNTTGISHVGCISENNTGDQYYNIDATGGGTTAYIGCVANHATGDKAFEIGDNIIIVACTYSNSTDSSPSAAVTTLSTERSRVFLNEGDTPLTERKLHFGRNVSGSTINAGEVVVIDPTNGGDRFKTTTTVGDDMVWGVCLVGVNTGSNITIVREGFYGQLKVNGTTDIAIGDFLCTYSVAGIAAKATTGDMAFAIALEAYTANDSNGVIDALIISPRKL